VVTSTAPAGLSPLLRGARWVLTCLVLCAAIIVAVPLQHAAEPVAAGYQGDLARLTRTAGYTPFAPAGLPPQTWTPVSSSLAVGGANGPGTVTWHLGYATPSGGLASLEETSAAAAAFVRRMTNSGTPLPAERIAGRTWSASVTPARGQRSLYRTPPGGPTLVVTGTATWPELRALAASLRPYPR
jgi:hypothetical protein